VKKLLLLAAMIVLGFGALGIFGWVVAVGQHESPVPPLRVSSSDPLEQARGGLLLTSRTAGAALARGDVAQAGRALDAAKRASGVVGDGPVRDLIEQTREAIDDGNPRAAARRLDLAIRRLQRPGGPGWASPGAPAHADGAYDGATVIDARGVRLGEVVGIRGSEVELSVGQGRNTFGFIDFDGHQEFVPADHVIFGKRKSLGETMVMAIL
jgi:hypothetical protein